MKRLLIAVTCVCVALALGLYASFRWIVPRWERAVVAGKMPRTAVAAVVGKDRINGDVLFFVGDGGSPKLV
jgi:hypothetical protein